MKNKKLHELSFKKTKEWSVETSEVHGEWYVTIHITEKAAIFQREKVFLCPIFIELENKKITNHSEKSYPNKGIAEVARKRIESFVVENERFPQDGDTI